MTPQQKIIERAYQRAMNIRDSIQSDITEAEENAYTQAYLDAHRHGDTEGFRLRTRRYLLNLRSWSKFARSLNVLVGAAEQKEQG